MLHAAFLLLALAVPATAAPATEAPIAESATPEPVLRTGWSLDKQKKVKPVRRGERAVAARPVRKKSAKKDEPRLTGRARAGDGQGRNRASAKVGVAVPF